MKKKWFDVHLYLEHLRQLRVIGLTSLILLSLIGFALPLTVGLESNAYVEYADGIRMEMETVASTVNLFDLNPVWPATFCLVAPLLTLAAFAFLNKRASSDFYHSIPQTRTCLFFSVFAAVATWITVVLLGSTAVSAVTTLFFPKVMIFHWAILPVTLLGIWSAALFVAAAVALAMCVTGTVFTNIVVALLIIFVPRALLLSFAGSLANPLPILDIRHPFSVLPWFDNTASAFVFSVFDLNGFSSGRSAYVDWVSGVYTLAVTLLLLLAAWWLFRRRPSESAGMAAPNRTLQAVFRMTLAGLPMVLFLFSIYEDTVRYGRLEVDPTAVFLMSLLILAIYFLYELISTRKPKNLLRIIPGLGVMLLIGGVLVAALHLSYQSSLHVSPSAEQIDAVQLIGDDSDDYFEGRAGSLVLEDEATRTLVADRLQYTIGLLHADGENFPFEKYYDAMYRDGGSRQLFAIRCGARTYYRYILLSLSDREQLAKSVEQDPAYRRVFTELPERVDYLRLGDLEFGDELRAIYDCLRQEVLTVPFEKWYALLQKGQQDSGAIYMRTTVGTVQYEAYLPLDATVTPKTVQLYLETMVRVQGDRPARMLQRMQAVEADNQIAVTLYMPDTADAAEYRGRSYWCTAKTEIRELYDWLSRGSGLRPSADHLRYCLVRIEVTDKVFSESDWEWMGRETVFLLPDDTPCPLLAEEIIYLLEDKLAADIC